MSKLVTFHVSDESYEASLYLARLAYKDAVWVLSQWVTHSKDEALDRHDGLRQHLEVWRADKLRAFQRAMTEPDDMESDDPPF